MATPRAQRSFRKFSTMRSTPGTQVSSRAKACFKARIRGGAVPEVDSKAKGVEEEPAEPAPAVSESEPPNTSDIDGASIRIDLSRIGGQR